MMAEYKIKFIKQNQQIDIILNCLELLVNLKCVALILFYIKKNTNQNIKLRNQARML